jgi:hypothetical protein
MFNAYRLSGSQTVTCEETEESIDRGNNNNRHSTLVEICLKAHIIRGRLPGKHIVIILHSTHRYLSSTWSLLTQPAVVHVYNI